MTITQTVDVPADRRVFFEFLAPREIPTGKARVELKVTPVVEKQDKPALKSADKRATPIPDGLKRILSQPTPLADALAGVLRGAPDMTAKEIRAERLEAKYGE